jgi:hypothetical protein
MDEEDARHLSQEDQTLGISDTAQVLRLGEDAVRELILLGHLRALSLNRKHWVLLKSDVLEYVRKAARTQQLERQARFAQINSCATQPPVKPASAKPHRQRRRPIPSLD